MMRYFYNPPTKEGEKPRIEVIRQDDFQVICEAMLGHSHMMRGLDEMRKRGIIDAVAGMSKFNAHYLETFANNNEKIASFCYEQYFRMLPLTKDMDDEETETTGAQERGDAVPSKER